MKSIVKIGYTQFVLDPEDALKVVGVLMNAEIFESKYQGGDRGSTYHIYEQEGQTMSIEMMPESKYKLCKLAGKPTKE